MNDVIDINTPPQERKRLATLWTAHFRKEKEKLQLLEVEYTPTPISQELWWMPLKKEQDKLRAQQRKKRPDLKTMFQFVDENELIYTRLDSYHHRIQNPKTGKFIDWWDGKKRTMRKIDGTFDYQGNDKSFLLQELANLIF